MVVQLQSLVRRFYHRRTPPRPVDQDALQAQIADYFALPPAEVQQLYTDYRSLSEQKGYAEQLGETKTLCFEEAFIVHVATTIMRPQQVVEIGTQHAKSTRRIVDILRHLGLDSQVTCFDIVDETRFVRPDEIDLKLEDITNTFRERVLDTLAPTVIYLDAHPYYLLKNVITEYLEWSKTHPCILTIHDCTPATYVPIMLISKDDPGAIGTRTGHWERHTLADVFHVPNDALDDLRTATHHLRIFDTPHGLAVVAPHTLLEPRQAESGGV